MKIIVLLTLSIFFLNSCFSETSCNDYAEVFRNDELKIIYQKKGIGPYRVSIVGLDPDTLEEVIFKSNDYTWISNVKRKWEKGDTIIKRKGVLEFELHKRDTVLYFPLYCQGKIYK
ncbi:hypothetical protein [Arcticibacterium luteifluviistationis]|nr:hypothetical protein [Arcticibacterium luteifluviistationis]